MKNKKFSDLCLYVMKKLMGNGCDSGLYNQVGVLILIQSTVFWFFVNCGLVCWLVSVKTVEKVWTIILLKFCLFNY